MDTIKLEEINLAIKQTHTSISNNINLVIERGEKLEDLEEKSLQLSKNSNIFYKKAKKVRRYMLCNDIKIIVSVIIFLSLIIWFVLSMTCGFSFDKCF